MSKATNSGAGDGLQKPHTNGADYFQVSQTRSIKGLLQLPGDDHGHIEGKVFMVWQPKNGVCRIYLQVVEDSVVHRFEVEFPSVDGVALRVQDRIRLALKGSRLHHRKQSNNPYSLPIALKYPDGVIIQYLSGINQGKVVDTWQGTVTYNPSDLSFEVPHLPQLTALGSSILGKVIDPGEAIHPNEPSIGIVHQVQPILKGGSGSPIPQLLAGLHTQVGDYFMPLSNLQKGSSTVNLIGVVSNVTPEKRTRTNEWSRSFTILDSSILSLARAGIAVNCFQKQYIAWLPQVQRGDVAILRGIKMVEFNGEIRATGFGDRLRWAVYDPRTCRIRPPAKGDAPEKETVANAVGYNFSPYFEPLQDGIEFRYCHQLAKWWVASQEHNVQNISRCPPIRRQHLLISDVSPNRPPQGFFDCTIEVLQTFENDRGAAIVYVTDYTTNTLLQHVQSTWCPPQLSNHVLRCDMWDAAKSVSRVMRPGEYWYLHNARAKWSPSRSIEATMKLAKNVTRLDEKKVEVHPQLKTLLARKEAFWRNVALLHNITIHEALLKPAPSNFTVLARVVDYYPFLLADSTVQRCTTCDRVPPPPIKGCPKCAWVYCFYLRLEDEMGGELIVSLSGKECNVLRDVGPADFRNDQDAFQKFMGRLRPILGNLEAVHAAWSNEKEKAIETPQMAFIAESWLVEGAKAYGLLDCSAV